MDTYKRVIKSLSPNDTVGVNYFDLNGSNEPVSYVNNDEIAPKKFTYVVTDWAKKNLFGVIFSSILIPFIIWITFSIFSFKTEQALSNQRLEQLKETVQELKINSSTKELLKIQLDSIEKDLLNKQTLNNKEIENRLIIVEKQIASLK